MWFLLYVNVCPWVPYEFSSGRAQFPAHSPRCFTSAKELAHLEASLFLRNEAFGSSGAIGLFGQYLGFIEGKIGREPQNPWVSGEDFPTEFRIRDSPAKLYKI